MSQPTNPIEQLMMPGASIVITLKTGAKITGLFYGFMPTKDATLVMVQSSDMETQHHYMVPFANIEYFDFPVKLSSLITTK